nr:DEAD/DEAH box helicase family protein [Carbonactinospora thermoautotrophica]
MVVDGRVRKRRPLRADFALLHGEHPIAVVEAKHSLRDVRTGVQQAREYARRLDLAVAYATNGHQIVEIDMRNQTEREVAAFRSPQELWEHHRQATGLHSDLGVRFFTTPYSRAVPDARGNPKTVRYYQHVALQRLLARIAAGERRLLAVLATGSGKTMLAMQLVHILWENHWPRGATSLDDRPRVLYLADRDVLVSQPMRDWFQPVFGDGPVCRVQGEVQRSKHLYFALYQALDQPGERETLFRDYDPDWFDLIIVDECHRGSARASSQWRQVLDHFAPAVQLGLTATPRYEGDVDTYGYFGEPVYVYSLRQGIEDGFLAPFEVLRVRLDIDVDGLEVPPGTLDREGREIPAGTYGATQLDRRLVTPERTRQVARYLTEYLRRTDPMAKTIVFCVDQEHAGRMREELVNLNSDLMRAHGDWVVRITADEGDRGRRFLDDFQREDQPVPVVAVTSQLLSTGVDVPTAKNIVLFRNIESMVEFKQIIGRGSRLAPEYGKEYFTIIDILGSTRKFEDPQFDGPPIRVVQVDDPDAGPDDEQTGQVEVTELDPDDTPGDEGEPASETSAGDNAGSDGSDDQDVDPGEEDEIVRRSRKYYLDGVDVYVASEALYVINDENGRLRRVRYEQWVRDRVLSLETNPESLRAQWATIAGRRALRELLAETLAFQVDDLVTRLNKVDCDPIDLLIWLAWDGPLLSRRDRVAMFSRDQREFLDQFSPRARQILATLLDKYTAYGVEELSPRALRTPPLSEMGSVVELAKEFGGKDGLRRAIDELGQRLFRAG